MHTDAFTSFRYIQAVEEMYAGSDSFEDVWQSIESGTSTSNPTEEGEMQPPSELASSESTVQRKKRLREQVDRQKHREEA